MRKSRTLTALGVLAVAALAIAGCSTSGGGGKTDAPASSTLVYGQNLGITQLNPNITTTEAEVPMLYLLWSGLTALREDGSAAPDLAREWSQSDDGLEWTFSLRDDVTFHDGTPFTAEDVVGTVEYVLDEETPSQYAAKISAVESVEAPDDTTVVFHLSEPSPQLAEGLTYIRIVNVDQLDTINTAPNGTGPYKFTSFVPGQDLVLQANTDYYGDAPKLGQIRLTTYADQTAAERALASGELTAFYGVPKNNIDSLLGNDSLQLIVSPSPGGLAAWAVDTTSAPFDDLKARQALSYAMDRETMVSVGYSGHAEVSPANTIVSTKSEYYNKDLTPYEFDLDKAKALFAEAGVVEGTEITFWTLAGSFPEWVTMAEVLQADLAKIGITLKIESNELNTWLEPFYPNGKSYPGLLVGNQLSFAPVPDTFSSVWFGKNGTCECNWKGTDEYNAAVEVVTTSADKAARDAAFQVIQEQISENVPMLIIANVGASLVAQKTLTGAWMNGDNSVHLENASLG